jgi:post-segregation antitoxin (ccd killing protein)
MVAADRNLKPTLDGKPRASASLRVDTALLAQARALGINPAESLEAELKRRIEQRLAEHHRAAKAAARAAGGRGFAHG